MTPRYNDAESILKELKLLINPDNLAGMARFGVNIEKAYGLNIPTLRRIAKKIGHSHSIALKLWASEIHEARILATLIDDPREVNQEQMESWVNDFNSWDLCDQCCGNLFDKTPFAYTMALSWVSAQSEFVKRAGFVMIAELAVHDKKAENSQFLQFFSHIDKEAKDNRNFVKKAINWSIRQVGKRNKQLHKDAIALAESIYKQPYRSSKWIATNALKELNSERIVKSFMDS